MRLWDDTGLQSAWGDPSLVGWCGWLPACPAPRVCASAGRRGVEPGLYKCQSVLAPSLVWMVMGLKSAGPGAIDPDLVLIDSNLSLHLHQKNQRQQCKLHHTHSHHHYHQHLHQHKLYLHHPLHRKR